MDYRYLGHTGVAVSSLCFGTMSFGGDADEATAGAMFARCREAGINFFDTANVYAEGRSETILGGLIEGCRDELIISSKVHFPVGSDINARGGSRRHIMQQIESSLKRLRTDRLDLYFLHSFDPHTPMEESLRALDDLVRQGKVLYPAVSNWAAWQIATALGTSALRGWTRFECMQPMYSLVKRQAEVELLPLAQAEQLGAVCYSPLGGGLLSGKYTADNKASDGRLVQNKVYAARYGEDSYYQTAERFCTLAAREKVHPATLAVSWVKSHPGVTSAIIGARSVEQLEPSLSAAGFAMTPALRTEISALSPQPPNATDRSEEQQGLSYMQPGR